MNEDRVKKAIETMRILKTFVSSINLNSHQAYDTAIEALQKRIPTKLIKQTISRVNGSFERYRCPCCNSIMTYDQKNNKHCIECGQALDWE